MNTSSNLIYIAIAAAVASLFTSGCGDPCLPTIGADTIIIPAEEQCGGADSTSIDPTGDASTGAMDSDSATTGPVCEPPPFPVDAPTCISIPNAGEPWGPCFAVGTCNDGVFCRQTAVGSLCQAECDDCGCESFKCLGGTCLADGECSPQCEAVGDPCPVPTMVCDPSVKMCVYPEKGPECTQEKGKEWGPCDDGVCSDGSTCIASNGADICSPNCLPGGDPCGVAECKSGDIGGPVCNANGPTTACGYECETADDCGQGQVCNLHLCMWLN